MVTVTALNNLRCSLRPELIAAVLAGPPTTVRLTNGMTLEIRESPAEVERQLGQRRGVPSAVGGIGHGGAH